MKRRSTLDFSSRPTLCSSKVSVQNVGRKSTPLVTRFSSRDPNGKRSGQRISRYVRLRSSLRRPLRSPRSGMVDASIRRVAAAVILGAVVLQEKRIGSFASVNSASAANRPAELRVAIGERCVKARPRAGVVGGPATPGHKCLQVRPANRVKFGPDIGGLSVDDQGRLRPQRRSAKSPGVRHVYQARSTRRHGPSLTPTSEFSAWISRGFASCRSIRAASNARIHPSTREIPRSFSSAAEAAAPADRSPADSLAEPRRNGRNFGRAMVRSGRGL